MASNIVFEGLEGNRMKFKQILSFSRKQPEFCCHFVLIYSILLIVYYGLVYWLTMPDLFAFVSNNISYRWLVDMNSSFDCSILFFTFWLQNFYENVWESGWFWWGWILGFVFQPYNLSYEILIDPILFSYY